MLVTEFASLAQLGFHVLTPFFTVELEVRKTETSFEFDQMLEMMIAGLLVFS